MTRRLVRDVTEISPAEALGRAQDHTISATRAIAALPDRAEDPTGHAEGVVSWHAHVKAANGYLEQVRRDVSGMLTGGDGDSADAASDAALADPEARAARQVTRATAALILNAAGNSAGAQKLLHRTPTKPRRK